MLRTIGILLSALFIASAALATDGPRAEYSANQTIETADMSMKGRVYYATGKERREMVTDGGKMTMILRQDKKVTWMLMPEESVYREMPLQQGPANSGDLSGYKILESSRVGEETVNGVPATKYKVIMQAPDGAKMGGFHWLSKDSIALKADMIAVDQGSKTRLKFELSDLRVGRQDPSLFEVPAGYSKMDMPSFGSMMGGADKGASNVPEKKGTFDFRDAFRMLK
jgi:hypothetical protein